MLDQELDSVPGTPCQRGIFQTPPASPLQGPSQRSWDRHHLLRHHVCTIERMERALSEKICTDAEWWDQVWDQYLECCNHVYSILGTTSD
nr:uncharacterized protein LOC102452039 isoform X2 [Pelodiscus sinensis]|eukprot:XP_025034137.1 uncharacterized protein LOC102452039 isoform X2 [Pelodiscus sinensis]